jgi:hypothetical protein
MKRKNPIAVALGKLAAGKRKMWKPFRINWGAYNPEDPTETVSGSNYTRRQLNDAIRKGWIGFTI